MPGASGGLPDRLDNSSPTVAHRKGLAYVACHHVKDAV